MVVSDEIGSSSEKLSRAGTVNGRAELIEIEWTDSPVDDGDMMVYWRQTMKRNRETGLIARLRQS